MKRSLSIVSSGPLLAYTTISDQMASSAGALWEACHFCYVNYIVHVYEQSKVYLRSAGTSGTSLPIQYPGFVSSTGTDTPPQQILLAGSRCDAGIITCFTGCSHIMLVSCLCTFVAFIHMYMRMHMCMQSAYLYKARYI